MLVLSDNQAVDLQTEQNQNRAVDLQTKGSTLFKKNKTKQYFRSISDMNDQR